MNSLRLQLYFIFLLMGIMACSNSEQAVPQDEFIAEEIFNPDDSLGSLATENSLDVIDSVAVTDSLDADDSLSIEDSLSIKDSLAKETEKRLAGMFLMKSTGSTVVLGNDAPEANVNERPAMKVTFSYDFWMSQHETTCGEFNELMKNVTGFVLNCENDSLPVTNVTYYDAVLFANERSKAAGFDTAYTYLKKNVDFEKHCVNLEGFEYHPERKSYRLPTEAEWIFAAIQNWNPEQNAWTAENSDYKLHPVCTKTDENEPCDLVGNAMEWMNDWFGHFRDTTVVNYVGAPDGGSFAQRVVKGGSYRSQVSSITLFGRGDVYTVTSSTRADYVGFRLAYGDIPNAVWMGANGKALVSRVTPLANTSSVHSFTKSYKTKLVFRNDVSGNLAFIDYSSGILSLVEIEDSLDAYHPEISPDGNRVAFCTKFEGVEGKSDLYVRDLNAEGSNLVKLDVESAAIPRWRVLPNGDTVIVYVTDAGNNKNESDFKSASTWQVSFANGKFGVPRKLFDGAYHGGVSADNRLAVTGARILRAFVADSGKTLEQTAFDTVWYNGEQACNVSLSQDGRKRTLFLDFASSTGRKFVGERYATHQRIFVADSTGRLIQSVKSPVGTTFDHSEWVSHVPNIAVATLMGGNGAHFKIVLVNLSDSSFIELAKGDELWHPNVWSDYIEDESENALNLDSACVYMTENSYVTTRIMKVKMDLFWQYKDSAEVVIIGSSRSFAGVDPEFIKSRFAINMAYSAEDLEGTLFYIQNYILPLMPKLKVIVLALDYDRWYVRDENWIAWFSNIPGYEYDKNHGFWKDGLIGDMVAASQKALNPDADEYLLYGYHKGLFCSLTEGWGDDMPEVSYDSLWFEKDSSAIHFNLYKLSVILELSKNQGVQVVGIVFPQSPNYLNTGAWGRYGPTRKAAKILQNKVAELENRYSNFTVMDEYHDGYHDYEYKSFSNDDHLGHWGAALMAIRLDSLFQRLPLQD